MSYGDGTNLWTPSYGYRGLLRLHGSRDHASALGFSPCGPGFSFVPYLVSLVFIGLAFFPEITPKLGFVLRLDEAAGVVKTSDFASPGVLVD